MFSWKGRDGSVQWLDKLGNNSCNRGLPALMEDSGSIKDKNLLPITAIEYGPMAHESQSGNVTLGPLICYPMPENERFTGKSFLKHLFWGVHLHFFMLN